MVTENGVGQVSAIPIACRARVSNFICSFYQIKNAHLYQSNLVIEKEMERINEIRKFL